MDDLGYTPNVFARGLGLNTMQTIGIMCPIPPTYLAGAIYYLERGLRSHNYMMQSCAAQDMTWMQSRSILSCCAQTCGCHHPGRLQVCGDAAQDNAYITEAASELPIMLVNGYLEG